MDGTVNRFLDFLIRDFVDNWYDKVNKSQSTEFQSQVRCSMNMAFHNFNTFARKSSAVGAIMTVFQAMILHIREYREFELSSLPLPSFVSVNSSSPFSRLYTKSSIQIYLRSLSNLFVLKLLPKEDKSSHLILAILKEVMATSVFEPLVDLICDPDFINRMIILWLKVPVKSISSESWNKLSTKGVSQGYEQDRPRLNSKFVNSSQQMFVKS